MGTATAGRTGEFRSTLPRRERPGGAGRSECSTVFRSTLPRRERLSDGGALDRVMMFRSTLPRRERLAARTRKIRHDEFRSTLPRRERLLLIGGRGKRHVVSIHAPAKGATQGQNITDAAVEVSIHAPAKGATQHVVPDDSKLAVSIHAPAKGATPRRYRRARVMGGFDPRSREGSDRPLAWRPGMILTFRSTLPRRERRNGSRYRLGCDGFDPRSREGSDERHGRSPPRPGRVSIHAPAKGATLRSRKAGRSVDGFDPRSREGSDVPVRGIHAEDLVSIHAPAKGATSPARPWARSKSSFDPRSREGSDAQGFNERPDHLVSIHAPAKGATTTQRHCRASMRFRSTLPRRERPHKSGAANSCVQFRSTLPRRERLLDGKYKKPRNKVP